jgi:polysaccharide export outer membrane protein
MGKMRSCNHKQGMQTMKVRKSFSQSTALLGIFILLLSGCATQPPAIQPQASLQPIQTQPPVDYLIQAGDQLEVKFFYNPELNDVLVVRPDGKVSLQLIDDIHAAGLTPAQLDNAITEKYAEELQQPMITVIVQSFTTQQVFVGGEVNQQGPIDLIPGMTPFHAVLNAGGLKETARPESLVIIRKGIENRPTPIRVNLEDALYGKQQLASLQLQPFDIVYVPKTRIAKMNKFMNQYIRELLLFNGWGVGFNFDSVVLE